MAGDGEVIRDNEGNEMDHVGAWLDVGRQPHVDIPHVLLHHQPRLLVLLAGRVVHPACPGPQVPQ